MERYGAVQLCNAELDAQISADELAAALQSLDSGKAPGIHGLPADFYKAFWAVIGQDLLLVLGDSFNKGRLSLSCRRAVLTLLPKKGNLQQIKNWRSVALLCTDYKILSKVLATRLEKVMEHIIHVDQTYCVPSRLISDNVSLIREILYLSSSLGCDLGLISIDLEKAFDRVEHQYLWQTLNAQVLYSDIKSLLKINGGLSAPFKVGRGVRQGCSLSGMLYSMAIKPHQHELRRRLSGINLPGCQQVFKLSAYADDVVVIVKKQDDIDVLVETADVFGTLSSAKVNWGKSETLATSDELSGQLILPQGLRWNKGGFKYLGVYLGDDSFKCNWDNVLEMVEGRILEINNLVSSML